MKTTPENLFFIQQKAEITEYFVYSRLSKFCKDDKNKKILRDISEDELRHYHNFGKNITGKDIRPNRLKIFYFIWLAWILGLSFAFNNNLVIAITGLIMGIAAALSMASSGYLASQENEEKEDVNPVTAAIYTGVAYLVTVFLLVFPYFLFTSVKIAMAVMLIITLLIIAVYNYYMSVAKEVPFKKRFLSMAIISLGVGAISFGIGLLVKSWLGVVI